MSEKFNGGVGGAICDGCRYLVRTGPKDGPRRRDNREHVVLVDPDDESDPGRPFGVDNPMPSDMHFCGPACMELALASDLYETQRARVIAALRAALDGEAAASGAAGPQDGPGDPWCVAVHAHGHLVWCATADGAAPSDASRTADPTACGALVIGRVAAARRSPTCELCIAVLATPSQNRGGGW